MKLLALVMLAATVAPAQTPDVTMTFSSPRILLGEPVWVVVTATNHTAASISWNPGDYCFAFGQLPVTATVSGAVSGPAVPEKCNYGGAAGNCMMGGNTVSISAGNSVQQRFLLEGPFHFDHAGKYEVHLTLHQQRPFTTGPTAAQPSKLQPVHQTLTLTVLPADPAALLAREQALAAQAEQQVETLRTRDAQHISYNKATFDQDRQRSQLAMNDAYQTRYGLGLNPAAGMEPIFRRWLTREDFSGDARTGLMRLNTPEARAILEEAAAKPGRGQWNTLWTLTEMRDTAAYPLALALLSSANPEVHREAVFALGPLGGDKAIPKLVELLHDGNETDNGDAARSLGESASRAAVLPLIHAPGGPSWWLFPLTHHQENPNTEAAWMAWWEHGGKDAPIYTPYQCDEATMQRAATRSFQ